MLEHSSVTGNTGGGTGGIASTGTMKVSNSTIAENVAVSWSGPFGGVFNSEGAGGVTVGGGTASFVNVTLADNRDEPSPESAPPPHFSGGLYVGTGSVSVTNSVLALNAHNHPTDANGLDCTGPVSSLGYNYLQRPAGCNFTAAAGDTTGGDPQLGSLGRHGGGTLSMVPLPGSALIDHGSPARVGGDVPDACSRHDQRGRHRPVDGDGDTIPRCDIGAVERGPLDQQDVPPTS